MKMGKSLLCLHAKRSRWSRLRMRLIALRFGERADEEIASTPATSGRASTSSLESPSAHRNSRVWTMPADD